ncbi:hypothetical protein T190_31000 [Sinorhizobium meliloti CCBAU 01290]|nr:hypothetical protein T190_31000 [Sinorhizobium meliloti CCBAU 01290]
MKQPRPPVFDGFQEIGSAVAILNIGAVHHEADHQPERVDNDVALAALNLLACIKATEPPLSVVLTLWLSIAPAVGEASFPSNSRASMTR